ncbi:MAG: hypothetical protein H0X29_10155 [Parachlamydiaceae bacterium]|nr:hypothetical protein [Parachlamydiaceae bacterium]
MKNQSLVMAVLIDDPHLRFRSLGLALPIVWATKKDKKEQKGIEILAMFILEDTTLPLCYVYDC